MSAVGGSQIPHLRADATMAARFWQKVSKGTENGCWTWAGATNSQGYGWFFALGRPQSAHRIAYALTQGAVPESMVICHQCDNPPCVNPAHLFIGTQLDNIKDRDSKGRGRNVIAEAERAKTHCPRGHSYAEFGWTRPSGKCQCLECSRLRLQESKPLGPSPLTCGECSERFRTKRGLSIHQFRTHGIRRTA